MGEINLEMRASTRGGDTSPKELPANMYSGGKVGLVSVFSVFFLNDRVRGDQFSEVVHDETGKDFLEDVLHLFRVKGEQSKSIFELAERGLNTPAHGIELFKFRRWKLIGVKVGNDRFKRILRNFEAGNTEVHFIE